MIAKLIHEVIREIATDEMWQLLIYLPESYIPSRKPGLTCRSHFVYGGVRMGLPQGILSAEQYLCYCFIGTNVALFYQ